MNPIELFQRPAFYVLFFWFCHVPFFVIVFLPHYALCDVNVRGYRQHELLFYFEYAIYEYHSGTLGLRMLLFRPDCKLDILFSL
jgi:hypothetical protein